MGQDFKDFKIPDWRMYKVAGIKELEEHARLLAAKGLKDPWIRNETWKYGPRMQLPYYKAVFLHLGRGMKWAFPAMLLTVAVNHLFWHDVTPRSITPDSSHEGSGHY